MTYTCTCTYIKALWVRMCRLVNGNSSGEVLGLVWRSIAKEYHSYMLDTWHIVMIYIMSDVWSILSLSFGEVISEYDTVVYIVLYVTGNINVVIILSIHNMCIFSPLHSVFCKYFGKITWDYQSMYFHTGVSEMRGCGVFVTTGKLI